MDESALWQAAVEQCFLRWDVGRTAVEEQWGGGDSLGLVQWMAATVADHMARSPDGWSGRLVGAG